MKKSFVPAAAVIIAVLLAACYSEMQPYKKHPTSPAPAAPTSTTVVGVPTATPTPSGPSTLFIMASASASSMAGMTIVALMLTDGSASGAAISGAVVSCNGTVMIEDTTTPTPGSYATAFLSALAPGTAVTITISSSAGSATLTGTIPTSAASPAIGTITGGVAGSSFSLSYM